MSMIECFTKMNLEEEKVHRFLIWLDTYRFENPEK